MVLFLGFLLSSLVATSAMAECQDSRCRIVLLTGELESPIIEDLKSLDKNGGYIMLTTYPGLMIPDFLHKKDISNYPGQPGTLIQRRRMLITAYSEPGAWEASE